MQPTSLSLLNRLQQERRHEDWSRFVDLYQPFIRRFIKMDPALAADADDICQEVMRKIVSHLPKFQRLRDGSFRCWLRTITVNEVNAFWRQRLRTRNAAGGERVPLESLADPADALARRWDEEHGQFVLERLQELIEPEFAPTTWRAFQLRVLEGKSSEEVAGVLGITRNAVDIAKSRVVARLRREATEFLD